MNKWLNKYDQDSKVPNAQMGINQKFQETKVDNAYRPPNNLVYLQQQQKQNAILRADTRSDEERRISQEYAYNISNPSVRQQVIEGIQKIGRWTADPLKGFGDIVGTFAPNTDLAKSLPNTNEEILEYRKKQLNPYISTEERLSNLSNEALPLANWSMLNALPGAATTNILKSGKSAVANQLKPVAKPIASSVDDVGRGFKSEIDWNKWSKDAEYNPNVVKHLNEIEATSKTNGTWMKNLDGSKFQGTPEQFVVQQSDNFKNAFPEGFENVWRGVPSKGTIKELAPERSMFTADRNLAGNYTSKRGDEDILTPFSEFHPVDYKTTDKWNPRSSDGIFNLAHKKSPNSIELDNFGREWTAIDLTNPKQSVDNINLNIKHLEKQVETQRNWLKTGKQNSDGSWSFPDSDIKYSDYLYKQGTEGQEKILQSYKDRLKNIDELVKNPKELEKMKLSLGDKTTTDEIAKYIEDVNLDYVKIKNVYDSGLGDVSIVNHKKGNYLKSLVGNIMFDMTNPNIYKTLIPVAIGAGAALQEKKQEKKQGGTISSNSNWLNKYK